MKNEDKDECKWWNNPLILAVSLFFLAFAVVGIMVLIGFLLNSLK